MPVLLRSRLFFALHGMAIVPLMTFAFWGGGQRSPLADLRAYYLAGERLNAGLHLYGGAQIGDPAWYGYPPLLAIAFRPLALLPFDWVALGYCWAVGIGLALLVHRVGTDWRGWLVLAVASYGLLFGIMVGQVELVTSLLLAVGSPASVALAGQVKLVPVLVGLYWIGQRDWRSVRRLVVVSVLLVLVQLVLEPRGFVEFVGGMVGRYSRTDGYWYPVDLGLLHWFGPVVWAFVVALVGGLVLLGRGGWLLAVVLSIVAAPRILVYQFSALIAVVPSRRLAGPAPMDAVGASVAVGRVVASLAHR